MMHLVFLLLLLALLHASTSQIDGSEYANCSAPLVFRCGSVSLNISYPFLAPTRPEYCDHPGYRISCIAGEPTVQFGNDSVYLVKGINYADEILTLVERSSGEGDACPVNISSTLVDPSLFEFTSDNQMLRLFRCNDLGGMGYDAFGLQALNCFSNKTGSRWYYSSQETVGDFPVGSCSAPVEVRLLRAAVNELNGGGRWGQAVSRGFQVRWKMGSVWCSNCLQSGGKCGFDMGDPYQRDCFCPNRTGAGSCTPEFKVSGNGMKWRKELLIACGPLLAGLFSCIIVALLYTRRRRFGFRQNKQKPPQASVEDFLVAQGPLALTRYSYKQVKQMTSSFRTKLGHGGYGSVFKGNLLNNNALTPVAVKLLCDSKGRGEDFINEVASIGRTNHVNIVSLLGFCSDGSKRALIYEFMPNGSLEKYLFSSSQNTSTPLGWDRLYKIALGIAKGLEYLHKGCRTRIVHFDIKPHNILLDESFCPKISDFGMAKFCRTNESILSMDCARGTVGYIAPEVFSKNFGDVSSKSDVYSYGMMVLEMVGGRRNFDGKVEKSSEVYFPRWIYEHLGKQADLVGDGIAPENADVVRKMAMVGLWCIQTNPSCRPSIGRAVEMLEGRLEDLEMPPRPFMCSPERSTPNISCSYSA